MVHWCTSLCWTDISHVTKLQFERNITSGKTSTVTSTLHPQIEQNSSFSIKMT